MTGFGFLILFGLSCLFPCEGAVSPPPNGTSLTLAPGSTGRIVWSFNDKIQVGSRRTWSFLSRDGGQPLILAILDDDKDDLTLQTSLYEIAIEKPATLILRNVNETYNGTYRFSLSVSVGAGTSDVAVFIAVTPFVQVDCRSPTIVNITDDFTCVCKGLGGNPAADVTWYKGNEQKSGPGKEEQDLNIPNCNKGDAGIYRCEAKSHEKAKNETEVVLIINYPPENVKLTLTRNGDSATIECSADAQPPASFKIFLNKATLVKSDKMHTISEVNSSDVGNYTCVAENILGNKTSDPVYLSLEGPTTQITPTSSVSKTTASQTITTTGKVSTKPPPTKKKKKLPTGAIVGIIIGVLLLIIIIVVVVVYCCKSKEKERSNSCANIDPVPGNGHELEEPGPSDGAYDTLWTSGSKSKAPVENALPPVYAAVDKNNRQGNTLYASLDNEALKPSRASKKEPDRPPQTDYASIDFAKTGKAPKAV